MDPEDRKRIQEIEDRFEESRAGLMTQLFITLATANGGGLAAVLAMISQGKSPAVITPYLTFVATLLGLGLFIVLVSAFYRFEHSKIAEKEKIAKIKGDDIEQRVQSGIRQPLLKKYKCLMWSSLIFLLLAIVVGVSGAVHNYIVNSNRVSVSEPCKTPNADAQKEHAS